MSESKLQSKVIKELQFAGWYVVRVIAASKAGVSDLICCDPEGLFVAFEIKIKGNKLSKLQWYNIEQIKKRNGLAYVIYDVEEVRKIINSFSTRESIID